MTGIAHAVVGVVLHRHALAEIAKSGVVATVPDHGERATAFWFLLNAPTLWLAGRLLRAARTADDRSVQRTAGQVLVATGIAGATAMPVSPFWVLVAIGAAAGGAARIKRPSRPHALAMLDRPSAGSLTRPVRSWLRHAQRRRQVHLRLSR